MFHDDWQRYVLEKSTLRRGRKWAAFAVGQCLPRQNGKNGIAEVRELAGPLILGEKLVIHTAHLGDTMHESFRRMDAIIEANEWLSRDVLHIWRANGREAIEFRGGGRIRFRTRTSGGGRGYTGDFVLFDEAMYLSEASMAAILPALSAMPDSQIWYMGSAVDQLIHDDGVPFARLRERALRQEPGLAYFEWSLDAKTPDYVDEETAADPAVWAATNPALGIRIDPDHVENERRELSARSFAVERLCVGDWPAIDGTSKMLITGEDWDALKDETSELVGAVCIAYDIAPDRSMASIAAAGVNQRGEYHVEITDHRRGVGWVPARFQQMIERHDPAWKGCDSYALLPGLDQDNLETVNATDHGIACVRFVDSVRQKIFNHLGSEELRAAVRSAQTRPMGDAAWAWSRKGSPVDITPLVAATLALWAAVDHPDVGETAIY